MACGEFAKPIFDVFDALGGTDDELDHTAAGILLVAIVKGAMTGTEVEHFAERFRRDLIADGSEEEDLETSNEPIRTD